jgi:CheY-like chemotaxis protein
MGLVFRTRSAVIKQANSMVFITATKMPSTLTKPEERRHPMTTSISRICRRRPGFPNGSKTAGAARKVTILEDAKGRRPRSSARHQIERTHQDHPGVVLTSSAQQRDLVACCELGANSYIVKPVNFASFTKAVSEVGCYSLPRA